MDKTAILRELAKIGWRISRITLGAEYWRKGRWVCRVPHTPHAVTFYREG